MKKLEPGTMPTLVVGMGMHDTTDHEIPASKNMPTTRCPRSGTISYHEAV